MFTYLDPNTWVLLAGGCYVLGFLIINQAVLRIFLLVGSFAYVAYYATVDDAPLWGAIYTTLIITAANALGFAGLLARNAAWSVPQAHRDIYDQFPPLRPGEFRALVRLASRETFAKRTRITTQGTPVSKLYYVIKGDAQVTKGTAQFLLPAGVFVGEVAYLMNTPSAATTDMPEGAEVLCWDLDRLQQAVRRKPELKLALDAVISRDLARKVALAVAPSAPAASLTA